jgi:hypothetical protein
MGKLTRFMAAAAWAVVNTATAQELTITNARIIVRDGGDRKGSIVVRDGKDRVGCRRRTTTKAGKVIDAKGMSAMAGFIDAHRHINAREPKTEMQRLLEAGFTTVLSGGGAPEPLVALRAETAGPHVPCDGNELAVGLREAIRERQGCQRTADGDGTLLGVKYTGELILSPVPVPLKTNCWCCALLDEGSKVGVGVQVHATSTSAMDAAVANGVKLLVHIPNKNWITKRRRRRWPPQRPRC